MQIAMGNFCEFLYYILLQCHTKKKSKKHSAAKAQKQLDIASKEDDMTSIHTDSDLEVKVTSMVGRSAADEI